MTGGGLEELLPPIMRVVKSLMGGQSVGAFAKKAAKELAKETVKSGARGVTRKMTRTVQGIKGRATRATQRVKRRLPGL